MLFVFEGVDSVGKTTIAKEIAKMLRKKFRVEYYSFPGNEPRTLGDLVYKLHHSSSIKLKSIEPTSLQLLHIAAHIDVIQRNIKNDYKKNRIIILDRFWFSTIAYGMEQGINTNILNLMIKLENIFWENVKPSTIFLIQSKKPFNIPKNIKWARINKNYDDIYNKFKRKFKIIKVTNENLSSSIEIIYNEICKKINT